MAWIDSISLTLWLLPGTLDTWDGVTFTHPGIRPGRSVTVGDSLRMIPLPCSYYLLEILYL